MRPTTIIALGIGLLVGLAAAAVGVAALVDRTGGKLWFYWVAPLLVLTAGAVLLLLGVQYWMRVGKLEVRGRPRRA